MEAMADVAVEDTGEAETINAQSLYATLGLSPEDVDALAQIPESEISVETLPYLIMQLKAKQAEKSASATDFDSRDKSKIAAATDTDFRNKSRIATDTDARDKSRISQDKPETAKSSSADRKKSPSSSASARHSGSRDRDHHRKGDAHRSVEKHAGGRRERKSSRERQQGDDVPVDTLSGDIPTEFPHECSLCKCVVNSAKTWKDHITGIRHKKQELQFSTRNSRPYPSHKRPYDSLTGAPFDSTSSELYPPVFKSRVVVAKFPFGAASVMDLLTLCKPFGTVVNNLVLHSKGFVEFSSHQEAKNMVSHFQFKWAFINEKRISLYLSPTMEFIQSPPTFEDSSSREKRPKAPSVVCFSRLPCGEDVKSEVLELVAMFGEVWQSKFTECKALIEMVNWRDADIMVKYYHSNPLRIQGKSVKVTLSHIRSLRESSAEPPSRKTDLSKRSKQKCESLSSHKDKSDSPNQEDQEKETEDMDAEEQQVMDDKDGVPVEDGPEQLDEDADNILPTAEGEKKGTEDKMEDETVAVEENQERASEENMEEREDLDDAEFPDNLDDFVTLDELDNTAVGSSTLDPSVSQDGRVVVVWPVKRSPDLASGLTSLSAPFGNMVKHVLCMYKQEAMIEMETAEKAQDMVHFYSDHKAMMNGRPVSVSMCLSMKIIENPSRRSVFISGFPTQRNLTYKYSVSSILKLAKHFGEVTGYSLCRRRGTCYLQLDRQKAATKMVSHYAHRPAKFWRSLLKVNMCMKGDSLIYWKQPSSYDQGEKDDKDAKDARNDDEAKKTEEERSSKEEHHSSVTDCAGPCGDPVSERNDLEVDKTPLEAYEPNSTVGLNYVVPVTGFFCKLCNIFYSDEKRAKSEHCSSVEHYNNLKIKHTGVADQDQEQPDG